MYNECHDSLPGHPKTRIAAEDLGIGIPAMVGHLNCLWLWAMTYARDGSLAGFHPRIIASAALWSGDPARFVEALVSCAHKSGGAGFLERDGESGLRIHDWDEYGGKLYAHRVQDALRKREEREKKRTAAPRMTLRQKPSHSVPSHEQEPPPGDEEDGGVFLIVGAGAPGDYGLEEVPWEKSCPDLVRRTSGPRATENREEKKKEEKNTQDDTSDEPDISGPAGGMPANAGGSGAGARPANAGQPSGLLEKESLTKSPPRSSHGEREGSDVVALLASLGVKERTAQSLAASHSADQIRRQVTWLPHRKPSNPAAMLVRAIGEQWDPPAIVDDPRKPQREEISRQRVAATIDAREAEQALERERAEWYREAFQSLPMTEQAEIDSRARRMVAEQRQDILQAPESRARDRLIAAATFAARNAIMAQMEGSPHRV